MASHETTRDAQTEQAALRPDEPIRDPRIDAYFIKVRKWHGYIRFVGLPRLEDNLDTRSEELFVEPFVTSQRISPDADPDEWPKLKAVLHAVEEHPRLVLLGDPGSGKSTLVGWIAYNLAQASPNRWTDRLGRLIPVPMTLRELDIGPGVTWEALLDAFLAHPVGKPLPRPVLESALEQGRAFLLLDGLDEIGSAAVRDDLRQAVWEGMDRYPECRWLMTSRLVGYEEAWFHIQGEVDGRRLDVRRRAQLAYLAPFSDAQIQRFAQNWYARREAAGERARGAAHDLVQAMRRDRDTLCLARIPNLLTMMALIYRKKARLPNGRALLYNEIAEAYLETIDRYRKLLDHDETLVEKKSWLARVAFQMQRRRSEQVRSARKEVLASEDNVTEWIAHAMARSGRESTADAAREFVDYIARRSGLLLPRGEGQFAFTHLSFQEYFAACYLKDQVVRPSEESREVTLSQMREFAAESVWRETMVFLFELLAAEKLDMWLQVLSDALFGADFREIAPERAALPSLSWAVLLARLAGDPHSGLPGERRRTAFRQCWRAYARDQKDDFEERGVPLSGPGQGIADALFNTDPQYRSMVKGAFAEATEEIRPAGLSLRGVSLSPEAVAILAQCKSLGALDLAGTGVTDAGLEHLAGLTALEGLVLMNTQVTDAGLAHLAGLTALKRLDLDCTQVTDAGLAHLAGLTALQWLDLRGTQVTDAGLAHLAGLTALERLDLMNTQVTDAGLAHLAGLTALERLNLMSTQVTDAGVAHLAGLTALERLYLRGTQVTDAGLAHLAGLTALETLWLNRTQVTDAGVRKLQAALPECQIRH